MDGRESDEGIICSVISLAPRNTISLEGNLAICLDCRESSYFHKKVLCVISNILGGCIVYVCISTAIVKSRP